MLTARPMARITMLALALAAAAAWGQTTQPVRPEDPTPRIQPADPNAGPVRATEPNVPTTRPGPQDSPPRGGLFDNWFLFVLIGGLVLLMLWSSRARRRQDARKKEMLDSMKKGDRVTTIGGVIGTVIEVKPHEVVIKVDEQNNVRMRFLRSAIHHVGEAPGEQKDAKEQGKS